MRAQTLWTAITPSIWNCAYACAQTLWTAITPSIWNCAYACADIVNSKCAQTLWKASVRRHCEQQVCADIVKLCIRVRADIVNSKKNFYWQSHLPSETVHTRAQTLWTARKTPSCCTSLRSKTGEMEHGGLPHVLLSLCTALAEPSEPCLPVFSSWMTAPVFLEKWKTTWRQRRPLYSLALRSGGMYVCEVGSVLVCQV